MNSSDQNLSNPLLHLEDSKYYKNYKNLEISSGEDQNKKSGSFYVNQYKNKTKNKILFMIGILGFALQFYNSNIPGLLKPTIMSDMHIDEIEFQLFISIPTFLGVPLALVSGIMLDKIGYYRGFIISTTILLIGTWISVIGGYKNSFGWLLTGITTYNVGQQMAAGASASLLQKWYQGGELTQRNGYYQAGLRISIILSGYLQPRLDEYNQSISLPILVGAILSTVFYFQGLIAPYLDFQADKQALSSNRDSDEEVYKKKKIKLSDWKKFDKVFWILVFSITLNFSIFTIWIVNFQSIIGFKFLVNEIESGELLAISTMVGIIIAFSGFILKKFNRNDEVMIFTACCQIFIYGYILFYPQCYQTCFYQILPVMIAQGIFVGFFTLIQIPQIAMNSPNIQLVGTAYGLAYSLKNFGQAVSPLAIAGPLLEKYDPDLTVFILFIFSFVGLAISFLQMKLNKQKFNKNKQEQEDIQNQQKDTQYYQESPRKSF